MIYIQVRRKLLFGYSGMCLFFIILIAKDERNKVLVMNHEMIHFRQQLETLVIPFFVLYFIFWIFKGYRNIPFEKEAYKHEKDFTYLKTRKAYAWLRN